MQAHIKLLKLICQNIWMWSSLISSKEIVLPAVAFATFQIETAVPVKTWNLSAHGFNSELLGALIHMKKGVLGRFSSSNRVRFHSNSMSNCLWWCFPVSLWCCRSSGFVLFLLWILERMCFQHRWTMPKSSWWCLVLQNHSQMLSRFYAYTFLIIWGFTCLE